jgi:peptidoglycan hydrolase-like protein with peptidoglycan-binding domain
MTPGLSRGSTGPEVRALQVWLTLHYRARIPASGVYCPLTQGALRRFQAAHGLDPTGATDEATLSVIAAEEAAHRSLPRDAEDVLPPAPGGAPHGVAVS